MWGDSEGLVGCLHQLQPPAGQVCSPREALSLGPGPTAALRPPSSCPGRMNNLEGWASLEAGRRTRMQPPGPLVTGHLWEASQLFQAMALLGKLGIRSLSPPRILFFLASHRLLFRKGPLIELAWVNSSIYLDTWCYEMGCCGGVFVLHIWAAPPGWYCEGGRVGLARAQPERGSSQGRKGDRTFSSQAGTALARIS